MPLIPAKAGTQAESGRSHDSWIVLVRLGPRFRGDERFWGRRLRGLLAEKGALLTSHGETIAGLTKSLKDDAPRRRRAAARRAVLD